jgi:hypothetical protein
LAPAFVSAAGSRRDVLSLIAKLEVGGNNRGGHASVVIGVSKQRLLTFTRMDVGPAAQVDKLVVSKGACHRSEHAHNSASDRPRW